jgi:hypothetical protein
MNLFYEILLHNLQEPNILMIQLALFIHLLQVPRHVKRRARAVMGHNPTDWAAFFL